jgi:predicted metal-dependent hydrolase
LQTKSIAIAGIGNVTLKKSPRAKYVSLAVKSGEGVVVTIPTRVSYEIAEQFARSKTDWIKQHLEKMKKAGFAPIIFDEHTDFKTFKHKLVLLKHAESSLKFTLGGGLLKIFYPELVDVKSTKIQKSIKAIIDYTLRDEAIKHLPRRLDELSSKTNIPYNRLFIKNIKTRWGSCSARNNINLNIHLMRLPEHLIDYVILHELAHVVEKNHGKKFWQALDMITGGAKKFDKELKNYRINY